MGRRTGEGGMERGHGAVAGRSWGSPAEATVVRLAAVRREVVRWLWPGRVPLGKLTVLDGDPGVGKSSVVLDLAARVSRGGALADGSLGDGEGPAGVVLLVAEDGLGDTVRPRLEGAGADLERVVAVTGVPGREGERRVVLPRDWLSLARVVARARARLVVVDPLMGFLDEGVNVYREQDARRALAPLVTLAEGTGTAVLVVRHLTKHAGGNALYRGGGSIGIVGVARSGLLAARDPEDASGERRVLAVLKGNLAAAAPALGYRLVDGADGHGARVEWLGAVETDVRALVGERRGGDGERGREPTAAERFLREALVGGARRAEVVKAAAGAAGIAAMTLRRARERLRVVVTRRGYGSGSESWWELPESETPGAEPDKAHR